MKTLSMDSCQLNKSSQLLSILWAVSLYQNLLPGISHTWVTQFCGYSGVHYIPSWKQNIIQNGWSFLWLKLSPNFKAKTYFVTEPTNGNAGTLSKSTWVSLSKKKKKKKNLKGWWRGQEGGETKEEGRGRGVGWGMFGKEGGCMFFKYTRHSVCFHDDPLLQLQASHALAFQTYICFLKSQCSG